MHYSQSDSSEEWISASSLAAVPGPAGDVLPHTSSMPLWRGFNLTDKSWLMLKMHRHSPQRKHTKNHLCFSVASAWSSLLGELTIVSFCLSRFWLRQSRGRACDMLHNGACMGISLITFWLGLRHSSTFLTEWFCFLAQMHYCVLVQCLKELILHHRSFIAELFVISACPYITMEKLH